MTYHVSEIAKIVKGKWIAFHEDAEIRELLIDSRKAVFPAVSLFFALKGPRRDGHTFIKEAYKKGIRNFIVSEPVTDIPEHANVLQVRDVLDALQALAYIIVISFIFRLLVSRAAMVKRS